jgi:hypothetical protein
MDIRDSVASALDDRLANVDTHKLALASSDTSVDSPPFYNCFINRYTDSVTPAEEEQTTSTARS